MIALAIVWTTLAVLPFEPTDGDGRLYSKIGAALAEHDWQELFQIKWYGTCEIYHPYDHGCRFFYEHPPGMFLVPYLLTNAGFPAEKAMLFADCLYQLALLLGIYLIFIRRVSSEVASVGVMVVLLLPISFMYSLRATQETPVAMAFLISLAAVSHVSRYPKSILALLVVLAAFAGLVKGIMFLPLIGIIALATGLLADSNRIRYTALVLASLMIGGYSGLTIFEKLRMAWTGDTFWLTYLNIQLWHRALSSLTSVEWMLRTAKHLGFYAFCLVWYALPAAFLFVYAVRRRSLALVSKGPINLFACYLIVLAIGYAVLFSVFGRYSLRYIYPSYFMVTIGAYALAVQAGLLQSTLAQRVQRVATPIALAAFWGTTRCIIIVWQSLF